MKLLHIAFIVVLAGAWVSTRKPAEAVDGGSGRYLNPPTRWSLDFLAGLGNDQPSIDTLAFVNAWQGGEGTAAAYNPLATTHRMPGATCYNARPCVKNYVSYEDGLYASIETITNGRYPNILAGLQTNDVQRAFNHEELGVWGTGYGNVAGRFNRELEALVAELGAGGDIVAISAAAPEPEGGTSLDSARVAIVDLALSQVGKPYVLGSEGPAAFDCSGLVEWVYAQSGVTTTRTTFSQLDALPPVLPEDVQTGDMVYFQYPWDQHVGILADVDLDGTWDMIHAAAPGLGVIVTADVFNDPFYTEAIIGYRRAL